jgi:hypothetical protein
MIMAVTDLQQFVKDNMPPSGQIANAPDPRIKMLTEATAAASLQREAYIMNQSTQGMKESSAPAPKPGPGKGAGNAR